MEEPQVDCSYCFILRSIVSGSYRKASILEEHSASCYKYVYVHDPITVESCVINQNAGDSTTFKMDVTSRQWEII